MRPEPVSFRASTVGMALCVSFDRRGLALGAVLKSPACPVRRCVLIGLYLLFAIRVADQWETVAVLRFGRYIGLRGPGLFHMIPIVDSISRYVDQRVRVANVTAESTLTRDTVPVNVDAIVFWMVWNAEKSILEVQDFVQAIEHQRADRAARIHRPPRAAPDGGRARNARARNCSAFWTRRPPRGASPCSRWRSATCRFRRRCRTPCRREAQAERERQARIILGQAETEIAEKFGTGGADLPGQSRALHLRAMNMLYEAIKEKGSMVIVPSSAVETMGLGGMLGTASLDGRKSSIEDLYETARLERRGLDTIGPCALSSLTLVLLWHALRWSAARRKDKTRTPSDCRRGRSLRRNHGHARQVHSAGPARKGGMHRHRAQPEEGGIRHRRQVRPRLCAVPQGQPAIWDGDRRRPYAMEGGSIGFQIGVSSTDVIMLVMNERGMKKLTSSKFTLGADATATAGPVGRNASAQTDAYMHAEILSLVARKRIVRGRLAGRRDATQRYRRERDHVRPAVEQQADSRFGSKNAGTGV